MEGYFNYYIDLVFQMKLGNYRGRIYYAKPLFLLLILSLIERQKVKNNRISFLELCVDDLYITISRKYTNTPTPIQYPFYHLQSEPFWHLKWKNNPIRTKTPSAKFIRDNIDYAYFDNALWDLLQDAAYRERLRSAIVRHFFNETNEQQIPMAAEPENEYKLEGEATPRQLWALKRVTGIDYRDKMLTKQEASEMLKKANYESSTKSYSSDEEATPRQLWALRCATGIDYRGEGLTKAQAAQMIEDASKENGYTRSDIKDCSNDEKTKYSRRKYQKKEDGNVDNASMGEAYMKALKEKRRKEKEDYIKPGSLEDILSKCKTREEQLEAARIFLGEQ